MSTGSFRKLTHHDRSAKPEPGPNNGQHREGVVTVRKVEWNGL